MKRGWIIVGSLLCVTPVVADDVFDAAYVSNPAVCERAGEEDINTVLFEEKAWAVYPSKGILGGEIVCYFHDQKTQINGAWEPEVFSTTRCMGFETNFLDQVAVAPDSFNINMHFGDDAQEHKMGEIVEVISMRADTNPPDYESYAGLYTRCDDVAGKVLEWFN